MLARRGFGMLPIMQADGVVIGSSAEKSSLPELKSLSRAETEKFEAVPGGNHEAVATRHDRLP